MSGFRIQISVSFDDDVYITSSYDYFNDIKLTTRRRIQAAETLIS